MHPVYLKVFLPPKPKTISAADFQRLCKISEVLVQSKNGPTLLRHSEGDLSKIWPAKSNLLSSSFFYPYASRFIQNAQKLLKLGIPTPKISAYLFEPVTGRRIVRYAPLPGLSVRDALHADEASFTWRDIARFLHSIHEKGVYFRSIHLGNIIDLDHSNFGLIDFTDVTFYRSPIPLKRRAHNIHFIYKYQEDRHKMEQTPSPWIKESYLEQAPWNDEKIERFELLFERYQASKGYGPQY